MPSNTSLIDLLAEMRDLDAIERGEVSVQAIADRLFMVAPGFVVPRGYLQDNISQADAEAAWEEHCDDPATLAAHARWCAKYEHLIPPRPIPEPEPEPEPEVPPNEGPLGIFATVRRRLLR